MPYRPFNDHKYDWTWYTHVPYGWDEDDAVVLRADLSPYDRSVYLDRAEKAALHCAEELARNWVSDLIEDGVDTTTFRTLMRVDIEEVIGTLTAWLEAMTIAMNEEQHGPTHHRQS
jgi:hypothetical protein